jgi:hypothetical protein
VARFAAAEGLEVAREFVEVETGKGADTLERRPQLAAALQKADEIFRAKIIEFNRQGRNTSIKPSAHNYAPDCQLRRLPLHYGLP